MLLLLLLLLFEKIGGVCGGRHDMSKEGVRVVFFGANDGVLVKVVGMVGVCHAQPKELRLRGRAELVCLEPTDLNCTMEQFE